MYLRFCQESFSVAVFRFLTLQRYGHSLDVPNIRDKRASFGTVCRFCAKIGTKSLLLGWILMQKRPSALSRRRSFVKRLSKIESYLRSINQRCRLPATRVLPQRSKRFFGLSMSIRICSMASSSSGKSSTTAVLNTWQSLRSLSL